MRFHLDNKKYKLALSGVAESDYPTGPFAYIDAIRPNGNQSRDFTVFKDTDDVAYQVYSSENNMTLHICELEKDYVFHTKNEKRIFPFRRRESPILFKDHGKYYLMTSGCTGWNPNKAQCAVAGSIMGSWKNIGNPCVGENSDVTFLAQGTCVIQQNNDFIFLADKWKKKDLQGSGYIFLPLSMQQGKPVIQWKDSW